jgi:hypothetical protein
VSRLLIIRWTHKDIKMLQIIQLFDVETGGLGMICRTKLKESDIQWMKIVGFSRKRTAGSFEPSAGEYTAANKY